MKLVDLGGRGGSQRTSQTQDPGSFKNRTWGTLRIRSDCEREELTYTGRAA